ncbi:MAG: class I SAM-dependent methyltransferase [Acidobacteria bacterium]|nr:class I SAM-dependent methyltransferase [Acidobacteriota bacterium]
MKSFRTPAEERVGKAMEQLFLASPDPVEVKLENFPKYVRRQSLKRFLTLYEVFKMVLPIKGSVVDCGVFRGFSLMSWAKLSTILEPENLTRRIYGFDSYGGFPTVHPNDQTGSGIAQPGQFSEISDHYAELKELIQQYDQDRFLGHIPKIELLRGDATKTIPDFLEQHRHLLVSLLFLDFDLYEPTKTALECFVPRMPAGAVLAFDELDNPIWPGETMALLNCFGSKRLPIRRLEWDPYIGYVVME